MNPKPFSSENHLTVPVAMTVTSTAFLVLRRGGAVTATCGRYTVLNCSSRVPELGSTVAVQSAHERKQIAELDVALQGANRNVGTNLVAVASPDSLPHDIARVDEFADDPVACALGDAEPVCDVAQPHAWVVS